MNEHIDELLLVLEKYPPVGFGSDDGKMKESDVFEKIASSMNRRIPRVNEQIRKTRKQVPSALLAEVTAARVQAKFNEMMSKYKTVCSAIGYRVTQATGESGKATEGHENHNITYYEKKENDEWPLWSKWRSLFGHCARADMTTISESISQLKKGAFMHSNCF